MKRSPKLYPPPRAVRFYLSPEEVELPRNFIAELRTQLGQLGPPPACLRFCGCGRLVYRAAQQVGASIQVRKQGDGSYLIWKRPAQTVVGAPPFGARGDWPARTPGDAV